MGSDTKTKDLLYPESGKKQMRSEKGPTFIEVLIATIIFSVTALTLMTALQTATKARALAQTRATAESLASATLETVQSEPYVAAPSGGVASYSIVSIRS